MGVGHSGVEEEALVTLGMRADVIAHLGDPLVRRTHEGANALVVGVVEHLDDRVDVLEAHGLRPRLLLRHVVDAEKLVVSEEQPIHRQCPHAGTLIRGHFVPTPCVPLPRVARKRSSAVTR